MAVVLILGSHVASSRVGGTLANLVLALSPYEIDPIYVPTTLLGRHPGWGVPGGGAVSDDIFAGMLEGIAANGLFAGIDAVLTNYFASPTQIDIAARVIDAIKAANPRAIVLVDPVMGDAPDGLYVDTAIAQALGQHLVARADYLTPNLWELSYMTGLPTENLPQIRYAAQTLGRPTLVTSVRAVGGIGGLYVDNAQACLAVHDEADAVPKGTGDLLSALFLGHLLDHQAPGHAMAKALAGVNILIQASGAWHTSDLPIVASAHAAWNADSLVVSSVTA